MIAMHYRFTLPADYDMALIEQRIASNGARLDGFPGLLFKAYLYSRQDDGALPGRRTAMPLLCVAQRRGDAPIPGKRGIRGAHPAFRLAPHRDLASAAGAGSGLLDGACMARLRRTKVASHGELADLHGEAMVSGWDLTRWEWLEADFLPSLSSPLPGGRDLPYRLSGEGGGIKRNYLCH